MILASAAARVAPNLLKTLAILSDKTTKRSTNDRTEQKAKRKSEKSPHILRWSTSILFTNYFKILLTTERILTGSSF